MKQTMKKLSIVAIILASLYLNTVAVGAAGKKDVVLPLDQWKVTDNGGESSFEEKNKWEAQFSYDTTALEEGYYTSFLYVETEKSLTDVLGFSFELSVDQEINLNLNLISDGKTFYLENGSHVYLMREGSTSFINQTVENGTVQIPAGFSGQVMIQKKEIGSLNSKKIQTIGLALTQEENQNVSATIGKVTLVKRKDSMKGLDKIQLLLTGPRQIEIPSQGEFVYEYTVGAENEEEQPVIFALEEETPGVSITKEGQLTVGAQAPPQTLLITVSQSENGAMTYQVELNAPWYEQMEEVDAKYYAIPSVEDVPAYVSSNDGKWKVLKNGILIVVIGGFVGYLTFYHWKIKDRNKKRK